ncbi:MAG: hypothetical protein GKR89_31960 [Candidatus Latescibacteria bacterium]|nr:hypothetical protein [Candidatus Latescibacterota bacterium]
MRPPLTVGLFGALVLVLAWVPNPQSRRDTTVFIQLLRQAQCEYRGITATFEEVTRAYALKAYDQAELVRWEASPSPQNPEIETLVWAVFTATGPRAAPEAALEEIHRGRSQAPPTFAVIWRFNQLVGTHIAPDNVYARDALEVFKKVVIDFKAQMVLVHGEAVLRSGPGAEHEIVDTIGARAVLLLQERRQGWARVRVPATRRSGWIKSELLTVLEQGRDNEL